MRERNIEKRLVEGVRSLGGRAEKYVSPGRRGVPDRLVLLPGKVSFFVECKAPGEKPSPAQLRDHAFRRSLGFRVEVVDSYEAVDSLLLEFK